MNKKEKIELILKFCEFYQNEQEFDEFIESLTEEESDQIYEATHNAKLDILP